jgi:predicted homoserine dehydrogenase-like protein
LVLSAVLRGEATGQPQGWCGDVAAVVKRDLRIGEMLDGEGSTLSGLILAERSHAEGALPIGLANHLRVMRDIAAGEIVRWTGVAISDNVAAAARREMERRFARLSSALAAQ